MAATPDGGGYWLVASDGGMFTYGDAGFYGSTGGIAAQQARGCGGATPDGGGYWLVASDGGVFTYGDAGFFGSTGGIAAQQASSCACHLERRQFHARWWFFADPALRRAPAGCGTGRVVRDGAAPVAVLVAAPWSRHHPGR